MANRGYKLQEFVAHASNVKCLQIGKKSRRLVATGGEDHKVNLWAIGKPSSLLSLSGHGSSVESIAFDPAEALVVSGASTGAIKLWDLEEAKIVRTFTGHSSGCTAVEFHPFGEFFASGSSDSNLKIWDFRKKGCIHTYIGHTRRISTIKFTPDGRWVVSGGADNVVKIWDLTAGKLLHEFNFHEGEIHCLDFHPVQFLLATGSADRTVNFWDLETFELTGSAGPERASLSISSNSFLLHFLKGAVGVFVKIFSVALYFEENFIDVSKVEKVEESFIGAYSIWYGFFIFSKATEVRSISFHPDGKTLFCGLDDYMKVFSWEPIVCHDKVHMGWSKLGDLSIHEGNVLACSYYGNSVGVWVADILLIGPYGVDNSPGSSDKTQEKLNFRERYSGLKHASNIKSNTALLTNPQAYETTEIRNIYVDTSASKKNTSKKVGSINPTKLAQHSDSAETNNPSSRKKNPEVEVHAVHNSQVTSKQVTVPVFVPRNNPTADNGVNSRRESISTEKTNLNMVRKPTDIRNPTGSKYQTAKLTIGTESEPLRSKTNCVDNSAVPNFHFSFFTKQEASEASGDTHVSINSVAEKFGRTVSPDVPLSSSREICPEPHSDSRGISSSTVVKGAQLGRTRSLVQRWEKRETLNNESPTTSGSIDTIPETSTLYHTSAKESLHVLPDQAQGFIKQEKGSLSIPPHEVQSLIKQEKGSPYIPPDEVQSLIKQEKSSLHASHDGIQSSIEQNEQSQMSRRDSTLAKDEEVIEDLMQNHDQFLSSLQSRLTKLQGTQTLGIYYTRLRLSWEKLSHYDSFIEWPASAPSEYVLTPPTAAKIVEKTRVFQFFVGFNPYFEFARVHLLDKTHFPTLEEAHTYCLSDQSRQSPMPPLSGIPSKTFAMACYAYPAPVSVPSQIFHTSSPSLSPLPTASGSSHFPRKKCDYCTGSSHFLRKKCDYCRRQPPILDCQVSSIALGLPPATDSPLLGIEPSPTASILVTTDDDSPIFHNDDDRPIVVSHYWRRNDIKGGVGAVGKLPDHSVQADVISVLVEKLDVINLALFSCLLPVAVGLLNSQVDRHSNISLEMLLKLVATFGPVIQSTMSAVPSVGVDIQAERRSEYCKQCSIQLQKIKQVLPSVIRRGGLVAKHAQELNLVLQIS
ncbi:hypothetical protein GIB67_031253 [Kingdonia uniflora]|uniref:Katanin p80 WD40 repeat-containing subunit B1 homolog n=1 Tax=Kingdonia uniflora TaxID=39325 RepID=A0A7J7NKX9_9MAGN|nr:hypothetical protein GIB67_031253 [Kingdonia uniflora]